MGYPFSSNIGGKMKKIEFISYITEVLFGIAIASIFIAFYFNSDFSCASNLTIVLFSVLYLGVIPFLGIFLVIRGIYHLFFAYKDKNL